VLAIPFKRIDQPVLGFLSRDEVEAVLRAPDHVTWSGQRDAVLFATLYNTGETEERAAKLAADNRKRRAAGQAPLLPRENYYGWLINDKLADLEKLLPTPAAAPAPVAEEKPKKP